MGRKVVRVAVGFVTHLEAPHTAAAKEHEDSKETCVFYIKTLMLLSFFWALTADAGHKSYGSFFCGAGGGEEYGSR